MGSNLCRRSFRNTWVMMATLATLAGSRAHSPAVQGRKIRCHELRTDLVQLHLCSNFWHPPSSPAGIQSLHSRPRCNPPRSLSNSSHSLRLTVFRESSCGCSRRGPCQHLPKHLSIHCIGSDCIAWQKHEPQQDEPCIATVCPNATLASRLMQCCSVATSSASGAVSGECPSSLCGSVSQACSSA